MKYSPIYLVLLVYLIISSCSKSADIILSMPEDAGQTEMLAAKEIRKYIYLRTDKLPSIREGSSGIKSGSLIILAVDSSLGDQEYKLKTEKLGKLSKLKISGGSPQAVLYGAYEFAEQLGVRFYLYGDVIPDQKIPFALPDLDLQKKPLFRLRGILPFHDFPEGPDWWNGNDYKAVIAQLPKMKMNFIGFHCYPYRPDFDGSNYKAEPLVWIGKEEDVNPDGTVKAAYPVLYFNTYDSTWGYSPANTSAFLSGASQLFETDDYGADYMKGLSPWPHTEAENKRIFNESGSVFSGAFKLAHEMGVKVCIGTETPLVIPETVKKRYGIQEKDDQVVSELYHGMFTRIMKTMPIDYYWLWTPENWTWHGVKDTDVLKTEQDIRIAYHALQEAGAPFQLATCGWVLGPPKDRTEFDRVLPENIPFSCINRGVGYSPVEKGFAAIKDRSEWSIPWMEDDPDLLTAQLWAGRIRKDAVDSWKYGCDGLFGIHWRTRILSPNVGALAQAAWDCDRYDTTAEGRDLPVTDFYTDWVHSEFGIDDPELVKIFTEMDSKGYEAREGNKGDSPLNASEWIMGPGALPVSYSLSNIDERIGRYDFIGEMEDFQPRITGEGNRERFAYWLNAFKFNKAVLETTKAQIELNSIIKRMKSTASAAETLEIARDDALPKRVELAERWQHMNQILLSFVSTNGGLGTIANLEMHSIRKMGCLTGHDEYLKSVLKTSLPEQANVPVNYSGKMRIISTTDQSVLEKGEDFQLRIRVLSESGNVNAKLYYRPLGKRSFDSVDFKRLGSNVFETSIPSTAVGDDFEYYIEAASPDEKAVYPVTAGKVNCAVIVL